MKTIQTKILFSLRKYVNKLRPNINWEKEYIQEISKKDENLRNFYQVNKVEVLTLYRHMLKNIPNLETNYLRKRQIKERIIFSFRECSYDYKPNVILEHKMKAYLIIEKINSGIFPPFPYFNTYS